jgi:hypothetical protein
VDDRADRINAAALLLARGAAPRPALICGQRSLSYGELRRTVARAASGWRARGVETGEVVMLRGHLGLDHAVAFLGAMWAGAVPVPLRPALPHEGRSPVEFARDAARPDAGHVNGFGTLRWYAWQQGLEDLPAAPEVACDPSAPACWTEPRNWRGGNARVLPHRFALTLSAQAGVLPLTPVRTMLAMLRGLRRGTTVVLQPEAPRGSP